MSIIIENKIKVQSSLLDQQFIEIIGKGARLKEFLEFYKTYESFEIGIPIKPANCLKKPLIKQISASRINEFTNQYLLGGTFI